MRAITLTRITRMVKRDANEGICTACGATAHNVEPDAREYTCAACGEAKVYGAEELLMRSVV
jgi:predicted RNA-binding Zn-ribbon protein involved in translation (DUF1610 family)